MIFIFEFVLAVIAAKRGWNREAFLPLAIRIAGTTLFALYRNVADIDRDAALLPLVLLDSIVILMLVAMCLTSKMKTISNLNFLQKPNTCELSD